MVKKEEDGEDELEKTYITVYQLPSMQMCEDSDGNKTSIPVNGIKEFMWAPNRNIIVYASFPQGENVMPRVTFMEMPSRRVHSEYTMNNSTDLKLFYHP